MTCPICKLAHETYALAEKPDKAERILTALERHLRLAHALSLPAVARQLEAVKTLRGTVGGRG